MKVTAGDEVRVREASRQLGTQLEAYKKLGIIEKQDLLAMVAFDAIFSKLSANEHDTQLITVVCAEIEALTVQLDG